MDKSSVKKVPWSTRYMPVTLRAGLNIFAQRHGITAEEAANILLEEALRVREAAEGVVYVQV